MNRNGREPLVISSQCLEVGEEMVPYGNRLGPLEVGIPGNGKVGVSLGHSQYRTHATLQTRPHLPACILEEQTHIGRNLVVSATPGMQLVRSLGLTLQGLLKVHMNVLEF